MMRFSKLFKNGNSVALCITKEAMETLGLKNGDYVKSEIIDGKLVVSKVEE